MEFPYEITRVDEETQARVTKDFTRQPENFVQIGVEKWFMPEKFKDYASEIYNFEVRPSDVFICTLPRSGTTWSQEMIWLICNDLDYETAGKVSLKKRFPFIESHLVISDRVLAEVPKSSPNTSGIETFDNPFGPVYEFLKNQTSQRFMKFHLPLKLLPRKIKEVGAKVVYVARNPKDVVVSKFHFQSGNFFGFNGSFEEYVEYFMSGLTVFDPYWKHILDGWSHRNDGNVYFTFYEDFKLDMENSLRKLAVFLEKPLRDEDLPKLMDHLKFENVKQNFTMNLDTGSEIEPNKSFIRRGEVGGNPEMTEEISAKIDEWTRKNLNGIDFKFPYC